MSNILKHNPQFFLFKDDDIPHVLRAEYVPPNKDIYTASQKKQYSQISLDTLCVDNADGAEIRKQLKEFHMTHLKVPKL